MVAKTGRLTQSCASACIANYLWLGRCLDGGAVEQLTLVAGGDGFVSGEAGGDADGIAIGISGHNDVQTGDAVLDGKDLVGIGGFVADHGGARDEDGVFAAGEEHAGGGEHAGTELRCGVIEAGFENEDAGVGVDGRVNGGDLAGEIAIGISRDAGDDGHADFARGRRAARGSATGVSGFRCARWWRFW